MQFLNLLDRIVHTVDLFGVLVVGIFFVLIGYRPPWWAKKQVKCLKNVASIPGPLALPILGTSWIFSRLGGYTFGRIHEYYRDMFLKHGPIIKEESLWNVPVISIVERSDIEKVLRASGRYPIRPPTEVIAQYRRSRPDRYASTGIVNEQGEKWQHLRSNLTSDLTSPRTISSFLPQVERIAEDFCNLIKHHRDSRHKIEQLEDLTRRLGLETMCALILGRRMGFLLPEGESQTAKRLAVAVHHHFLACRDTYYGLPFWKLFRTPAYNQLVESEEDIYNLALELVATADDAIRESAIFQSILTAHVDDREKTAAIVDFIASGIHTLGNSLIFLLHLVGNDKQSQEKLRGGQNGVYLRACVNETFRLLPTANCLARVTEKDLDLSGHRVGAGSVIICQTGLACRDPKNFAAPHEFRPDRWLGDEKLQTNANATFLVIPFGCGRRACPGKRFIEQSLPVVLDAVVRNFDFSSDDDLSVQFEFLMAPKGPVSMTFLDRH